MYCQIFEWDVYASRTIAPVGYVAHVMSLFLVFVLTPTHPPMKPTHINKEFSTSDQDTDEWSKVLCVTHNIRFLGFAMRSMGILLTFV